MTNVNPLTSSGTSPEELMAKAVEARKASYSPYSGFAVGAAILCADGSVYTGANIENSSYPVGCCAERVALFKAVSEGHTDDLLALALCGGRGENFVFCPPCGMCRQALSEFCPEGFTLFIMNDGGEGYTKTTLGELLPGAFGREALT